MTAPTEEEIRATIARAWTAQRSEWRSSIHIEWDDALSGFGELLDAFHDYDDMRQSEVDRLDEIYAEERQAWAPLAEELAKAAVEAAVRAELRFWSEHPDAPRKPQVTSEA